MPTATCQVCGREISYRNTRGTRLADYRCRCGGELRGHPGSRKGAGKRFARCAVCGTRRHPGTWQAPRMPCPWRVLQDWPESVLLAGEQREGAESWPGQPGAVVCWTHRVSVPPLAARWILETACAVAGWGPAPQEPLALTASVCPGAWQIHEAWSDAQSGRYERCLQHIRAALEVRTRAQQEAAP